MLTFDADTPHGYRNEVEAGKALANIDRSKVFVITKYYGYDGLDIEATLRRSLKNVRMRLRLYLASSLYAYPPPQLGTNYVDLYVVRHSCILDWGDIPTAWTRMEALKTARLARSIGVSDFGIFGLPILLHSA